MNLLRIALAAGLALASAALRAHDPGLSTADARLHADTIEIATGLAPADALQLLPRADSAAPALSSENFATLQPQFVAAAARLWDLRIDGARLEPQAIDVQLTEGDKINFQLVYPRHTGPTTLRSLAFDTLPPGHRQYLVVTDEHGLPVADRLLGSDAPAIELPGARAAPSPEAPPTFVGFFRLGIEHIVTGYDHLLFLFALLVVCRSFRSIVTIVSCFTLAHSITLGLATLDIVRLPAGVVEPAIAASILFVGVENLLRRDSEPRGRWALTFLFGLIHGFGFAGVLLDLGVGANSRGIALPLFSFNLGVEIGQIAIAAVVLPIVWQLRKNPGFVRRGVPALSALVVSAGGYWLIERTILA